jgi:hypothetical protein
MEVVLLSTTQSFVQSAFTSLCCETNYIQLRMSFGSERFRTKSLGTAVLQVLSLHLTVLHLIALEH